MLTLHPLGALAIFLFGFSAGGLTIKLIDEHDSSTSQPAPAITITGKAGVGAGVGP